MYTDELPTRWTLTVLMLLAMLAVTSRHETQAQDVDYRVYLIGDTGGADSKGSVQSLQLLKTYLQQEGENSAVVFLGDNVYCCGLPDSTSTSRSKAEMRLEEALEAVEGFSGRSFFIPGNHDWGTAGQYSKETLARQQKYVESRLGEGSFLPSNGFPGPVEIKLTKEIRLVVVDTHWWLMDDKPFGDTGEYELSEEGDFLVEMNDLLAKRDDEHLLVVGHHPLLSFGTHGGFFPVKEHVFPLTTVWDNAWIPLPVLGSVAAMVRRFAGGRQDLSNPKYRSLQDALISMFSAHQGDLVYASGHEHSLQHIIEGDKNYLVSGSATRPSFVSSTKSAEFTSSESGFMILDYKADGTVHLRVISEADAELHAAQMYRATIQTPVTETEPMDREALLLSWGDDVTEAINPSREAGFVKSALMGSLHRAAWATPVTLPVFDVATEQGGLVPIRRGGGLQTTSLRLLDASGKQYLLRSMDKDPSQSVPAEMRETFITDVVTDLISIILPYSALLVPPLSEAAGVFYATPKLVYVPDDPAFGVYQEMVANTMMLFERRPADDMSAFDNFGNTEKVVSSPKMFRELADDNDHRVDERFFARSRMFDMFISDWDRHADQWRWATYDDPDGKGDLYKPIPRDRDWSFNQMNGIIPSIIQSRWVLPKFQHFRPEFGILRGLNGAGLPLDRRFTSTLTESDWRTIGDDMERAVTDASIQASLDALPAQIKPMYEQEFSSTLKSRRSQLGDIGAEYYSLLAALVDVVGSDKHEQFLVESFGDSLLVIMNKTKKDGEVLQELYRRTFYRSETEEIRLYGLGGHDRFELSGAADLGIRVYAVGGPGEDEYTDRSLGSTSGGWYVRDTSGTERFTSGRSTRDQITDDPAVLTYDSQRYWFEILLPKIILSSNEQDGLVLGGGVTHTSNVFHRSTYSTRHDIALWYAARSRALAVQYDGWFNERIGKWGLETHFLGEMEGTMRSFYGFGSDSRAPVSNKAFYRSEFEGFSWDVGLFRDLGKGLTWNVGTFLESTHLDDSGESYATLPESGLGDQIFDQQIHTGLSAKLTADGRDNKVVPRTGFLFKSGVRSRLGLAEGNGNYTSFSSNLQVYFTPLVDGKTTLATSIGWEHVTGDFQFFHSAVLGDQNGLRGWRRNRFSGNSAFYQNVEIRHGLFEFANMLTAGQAGVLAFFDNGSVFYDGDDTNVWHQGYGGGAWFNVFDMAIFQITVARSKEDTLTSFGFGFDL